MGDDRKAKAARGVNKAKNPVDGMMNTLGELHHTIGGTILHHPAVFPTLITWSCW